MLLIRLTMARRTGGGIRGSGACASIMLTFKAMQHGPERYISVPPCRLLGVCMNGHGHSVCITAQPPSAQSVVASRSDIEP